MTDREERRPLEAIPHRTEAAGTEITWPLETPLRGLLVALLGLPIPVARDLLPERFSPVQVVPGRAGLLIVHLDTVDSPVGPSEEILVYLLCSREGGWSLPGLSWLLHGLFNAQIGQYGLYPAYVLGSTPEVVELRSSHWGNEGTHVDIRSAIHGVRGHVQINGDDASSGMLLRIDLRTGRQRRPMLRPRLGIPLLYASEGQPGEDFVELRFEAVRRRYYPGGRVLLAAEGPLAPIATALGASPGQPVSRTPLASVISTEGSLWMAGPRALEPHTG